MPFVLIKLEIVSQIILESYTITKTPLLKITKPSEVFFFKTKPSQVIGYNCFIVLKLFYTRNNNNSVIYII